ncbi:hypothetical protein DQK91_16115 [Oceanidesulfovibrio marinus]|uniref:OmpA-like domain-containing protein n=2 Tax=Oceanidesulfovibrio marinus TaxID=370038 RepID=A0A6P1ZCS9_9BACT|nr:hypothetical protein DQK91_16115 [Oceanidesulfovibrio marinus]
MILSIGYGGAQEQIQNSIQSIDGCEALLRRCMPGPGTAAGGAWSARVRRAIFHIEIIGAIVEGSQYELQSRKVRGRADFMVWSFMRQRAQGGTGAYLAYGRRQCPARGDPSPGGAMGKVVSYILSVCFVAGALYLFTVDSLFPHGVDLSTIRTAVTQQLAILTGQPADASQTAAARIVPPDSAQTQRPEAQTGATAAQPPLLSPADADLVDTNDSAADSPGPGDAQPTMAKTEPALDADGIGAGTAKAPHQTQEATADPQTPAAPEAVAPEPAQQSVAAKDVQSAPLAIEEVQPSPPAIEADWPVIDPVASVEGEEKSAAASPADQERQPVKRAATLDAGAQEVGQEVTQSAGAKEGTTEVTRPMVASVEARSPTESGGSPPGLFPQDPSEYMDARKHDSEDAAASASQTIEETAALLGEAGAGAETAASLTGDGDSASDVIEEQGVPQETGVQARTLLARVPAGRIFVKGHDTLPPDSLRRIEELAATVRLSPGERLLVVGHTDDVPLGPELRRLYGTNFGLSLTRARQVRNLLVAGGVAPEAVGVAGVGNLHPLVPNTTTENREQNRRVDIWIVQKNRQQARQ